MIRVCRRYGAVFSLVLTRNAAVQRAIDSIPENAWTPVKYPGAVLDRETGAWISDAEVAEAVYTMAKTGTYEAVTARLIVRRVKDANQPQDGLFPIWRYHPFFTNTTESATDADITHRRHAIIETTFADLIDGPLAHIPSGRFGANSAWAPRSPTICCAPPRPWPGPVTAPRAGRPCAVTWSISRLVWPDPNDDRSCTYPGTGPPNQHG